MFKAIRNFFDQLVGAPKSLTENTETSSRNETSNPTPYRSSSSSPIPEKLVCSLQGEDGKSTEEINVIKSKTHRRAIRHFAGKEVKHRVSEKKYDSIEFKYFRGTSKPVTIRWSKSKEPAS